MNTSKIALLRFTNLICVGVMLTSCGGNGSGTVSTQSTEVIVPIPQKAKMAADAAGNLYMADGATYTIVKVDPAGKATLVAGKSGVRGVSDGIGANAEFYSPNDIAVDSSGNLYVTDSYNNEFLGSAAYQRAPASFFRAAIRKITPSGVVTTFAGSPTAGNSTDVGAVDGVGTAARFDTPQGITTDFTGNVYVADFGNHVIRKISPSGVVSTLAGKFGQQGQIDGAPEIARLNAPMEIKFDGASSFYVLGTSGVGSAVRKVSSDGSVTTIGSFLHASNLMTNTVTGKLYAISQRDQGNTKNQLFTVTAPGTESLAGVDFKSVPWSLTFIAPGTIATLLDGVISKRTLP